MGFGGPGFWNARPGSGVVALVALDLLRQFPDDVVLPVLSVASRTLARSPTLSFVLSWGVIAVILSQSMQYVYPGEFALWRNRPGLGVLLVACAVWTARTPTQLPTDEDRAVVGSAAVLLTSTWIGGNADALVSGDASVAALTNLVFLLVGVTALVYLPNAAEGDWTLGVGTYAVVAYLLAFGGFAGVASLVGSGPVTLMYAAVAVTAVGGAVAIAVAKRIES